MPVTIEIPSLHDRHSHTSFYAAFAGCASLAGLDTAAALAAMRGLSPDRLSIASGWHSAAAPLTDDDLAALPPVVIVNVSLHGFRLSPAAVSRLEDTEPDMVEHRADPGWAERHLPQLLEFFGRTAGLTPGKLETFADRVRAAGLGAVDDMLLPDETAFDVIRQSRWGSRVQCWATPQTYRRLSPASRQRLAGLKFFTDGAIGTRTAALRGTYRDGGSGLLIYHDDELLRVLGECHGLGKPIAIHAIGDRAIDQVVTVLERLHANGLTFPAVRMEHAQFISVDQARRARDLGVVLSMQPNFSSDSLDYADRLDAEQTAANNPFRMLIDRAGFSPGRDLIFGSDGMPHGVEYALQWSLFPRYPAQRLSVGELIAGYGVDPDEPGHSVVDVDESLRRVRLLRAGE